MTLTAPDPVVTWVDVCRYDDLLPERGVCALVGPWQVAVFRLACDGGLRAISNYDPFSSAFVLSRGIVGTRDGRIKVASPVFKQSFDLTTGECLEDPGVCIATFPVRATDGVVQVGAAVNSSA